MNKKTKTTIYISKDDETMVNELISFFLLSKNKKTKSWLFCEGIKMVYEKEFRKCK